MSRHHRRKRRFKLRSFYIWHRHLGVSAAALVLVIAVTGLLLNHTEDLQLDSDYVQNDWILDWYGIESPQPAASFRAGNRHLTLLGDQLYLGRRRIEGRYGRLNGAVEADDMLIVAVDDGILMLTPRGELIEHLKAGDGVPGEIGRIGRDPAGRPVVRTPRGSYRPDADFLRWQLLKGVKQVHWASPEPPDPQRSDWLQRNYRGSILPLERVVLDLHSGRFFGRAGPWLFDAAAVVLILLALSGTWIWLKRKR